MTDFKALYNQKKMTADEVAAQVESGWLIGMDSAIAQTPAIMDAVCRRAEGGALQGVRVQFLLDSYPFAFLADDSLAGKITGQAWFASSGARKALAGGWADYIPNYYRDCPRHIRANYDYDAFCVSVSPMDKHGYFSLGTVLLRSMITRLVPSVVPSFISARSPGWLKTALSFPLCRPPNWTKPASPSET